MDHGPVSERCTVGGQHLDPSGLGVRTGGKYSPPRPASPPGIAAGDDLPPQTDVPLAEMALHSVTTVRVMGISPRIDLQKGSPR